MEAPHPHLLVYCSAAGVQVSFLVHMPMYTLKWGWGAGGASNGACLGEVSFFPPLVLNRLQYCSDSSPEIRPWEVCPLLLLLGCGLVLEQFDVSLTLF